MRRRTAMLSSLLSVLIASTCVVLGVAIPASAALPYSITAMGTLGGQSSLALAVNSVGQAAGVSSTAQGALHAFLWSGGHMTDLGAGGGQSTSWADDLNDLGQVVGYSDVPPYSGCPGLIRHAFLWSGGQMRDLGTLGGCYSGASGINNAGWVTGFSTTSDGQFHCFLWANGTMTDLGTLGGKGCSAQAINNVGQIVGLSETSRGETRAFLWSKGVMKDLGTLGGSSEAMDVNDVGQVVGDSITAQGSGHAFLWSRGTIQDLGVPEGAVYSSATGINNAGQIVGDAEGPDGEPLSFFWSHGSMGTVAGLLPPDSGFSVVNALDIGNGGRIVGGGSNGAFIMSPG